MSLVVWLPLNGNLENQGLSNVTVTGTNTYGNGGKLGGKYLNSDASIPISVPAIKGKKVCSFAFWAYVVSASITSNWTLVARIDDQGTNSGSNMRFEVCPPSYANGIYCFSNHNNGNYGLTTGCIVSPNGGYYDKWVHFCFTSDGTTFTRYMNGIKIGTCPYSGAATLSGNFLLANNDQCYKQDVRIYDHCLSAKEVKDLAKGLVLHYRLAGPGQENLVPNSNYNNYTATPNSEGASLDSSVLWNGMPTLKLSQSGNTTYVYRGFSINILNNLTKGEKYTMTVYAYTKDKSLLDSGMEVRIYQTRANGASTLWGNLSYSLINNSWVKIQGTYTIDTNATAAYVNMNIVKNGTVWFSPVKVEKGSIATPWCPNPADALYRTMGYDNNIEYDCSGYQRNGTKSGTIAWDIDSPRYTTSYKWPAATSAANRIISPNCRFDGKGITMAVWVKFTGTTAGGGNYHMPLESSSPGYYEMSVASNGVLRAGIYVNGTRYVENCSNPSMYDGKWHHIAMTYDGTKICRYVDAKAYIQTNVTGTANGLEQAFYIGSYGTNTTYYNNNIWESDARVYTTALSAEDIAELYHSAVIVDNTGKSYAYEYFEAQ